MSSKKPSLKNQQGDHTHRNGRIGNVEDGTKKFEIPAKNGNPVGQMSPEKREI
jgi:hypothetical protein